MKGARVKKEGNPLPNNRMPILRSTPMKRKQRRKLARIRTSLLSRLDRQFELMLLIRRTRDESELGVACGYLLRMKEHKRKRK